jgi:hypothetical protein
MSEAMHMKIERRRGLLTRILGALTISVILLSGCGGSTQSAGSAADASVAVAAPQNTGTGTDSSTSTGSTPIASTAVASTSVASTPVASTPVASTPVAFTPVVSVPVTSTTPVASTSSSSSSSSGGTSGSATENVTLSWSAPTENTNGSALTNLSGYIIYYGTSASAMTQTIDINTVGMLTYVVGDLSAGNWYFQIVAVNAAGVESSPSATVNASI